MNFKMVKFSKIFFLKHKFNSFLVSKNFNTKKPAVQQAPQKTNAQPAKSNPAAGAAAASKSSKPKKLIVFTGENDIEDKKLFQSNKPIGENKYEFYSIPGEYVEKKENQTITTFNLQKKLDSLDKLEPKMYRDLVKYYIITHKHMKSNFEFPIAFYKKVLTTLKTENDFKLLEKTIYDLYNKNNKLSCSDLDDLANTCLNIGIPHKMIPLLKVHRSLMYYPSPNLMSKYVDYYYRNKDYKGFFKFIHETKNCFWITREDTFYDKAIKFAHEYNDKSTLVDILLYSIKTLNISDNYACILLYANEYILKDKVYQKLFFKNEYLNKLINNHCVGLLFAELIINNYERSNSNKSIKSENEANLDSIKETPKEFNKNIAELIQKINDIINDNTKEIVGVEIFYNKEIKREMILMSGNEEFMKLDKRILSYMDSKMKINIFEKLDINSVDNDVDKEAKDEPKINVQILKDELENESKKMIEERIKKTKKTKSTSQQTSKVVKTKKEIKVSPQTLYIARKTSKKAAEKSGGATKAKAADNKSKK